MGQGTTDIYTPDTGVSIGTAEDGSVDHPREADVGDEKALAPE